MPLYETHVTNTARVNPGALLFARVLFGGYFLYNAVNHILNFEFLSAYAAAKGVPAPEVAVGAAGVLLFIGGVALLLGRWTKLGAGALVLFLVVVTPVMHDFWNAATPEARVAEMVNFTKNLALIGGALFALAIPEPWPWAFGERVRIVEERPVPEGWHPEASRSR